MTTKTYRLLDANDSSYESSQPGQLGGDSKAKIYGKFSCTAANAAPAKGYAEHRVFFADEETAIAANCRPCGHCMRERYAEWHKGVIAGTHGYPWINLPNN